MSEILYDVDQGLATITLNRPDKLNAFNSGMFELFGGSLDAAASDPLVRAVLLTGSGRAFCVGQDLDDPAADPRAGPPDLGALLDTHYNKAVLAMRTMPKPVVVAVNGVAAGAGANLALAGDLVFAAKSAQFIQAFARVGLIPDAGGTFFLPRSVGMQRAFGLSMLAEPLTAAIAADWGMIWRAVDNDDLMAVAGETAQKLASGPTAAFAAIKLAMNASLDNTLDVQMELERDLQSTAGYSTDFREGVDAFFAKRVPRFEGR
jgi:2-(1,2-epoxy-1,2-dihydrophenyl)acetyl-CoA isomerase